MADLKGSKTEENLKAAFAGESQANRRYLYFASKADVEGQNDVAAIFRSTAEGETGHAHGHLEYLEEVGDPATGYQLVLLETILKLLLLVKHMNILICILAWLKLLETKVSKKLLTGLRHLLKLKDLMLIDFKKH